MLKTNTSELPPIDAWQVESMRLTAFPPVVNLEHASTWWKQVVEEPPDTQFVRPKKGEIEEAGVYEDRFLRLQIQPFRVDWSLSAPPDEKPELPGPTLIGIFPEIIPTLETLASKWFGLETCPPMRRIAFGAVLLNPVDDRTIGYRLLDAYLPSVELDAEGSSEFLYQINRRIDSSSGLPDLRINRLSKWTVSRGFLARFELGAGIRHIPSMDTESHFCRLELDINTVPEFRGLMHPEQLQNIFDELIQLGAEIAEHGDIK